MDSSWSALIDKVKSTTSSLDGAGRKQLYDVLQQLSWSLETPHDAMYRLLYSNMQVHIIRVAIEMKLFEALVDQQASSSDDLAAKLGASAELVDRICRYLASFGIIAEIGEHQWKANGLATSFTVPGWIAAVNSWTDIWGPIAAASPTYLRQRRYSAIVHPRETPFQSAFDTDLDAFGWLMNRPEQLSDFGSYMNVHREPSPTCFDVYPFEERSKQLSPEQVFLVDVGGGLGHQAIRLREMLPQLPNRIVNQDLKSQLDIAVKHSGVENVAQNFFETQTIKGAKLYYFRNVMHDWPDDKVVEILNNSREALGRDSAILIDEMCLPERDVSWKAAQLDLILMMGFASKERSIEQWRSVIGRAGLMIAAVHQYTASLGDAVIECVAK